MVGNFIHDVCAQHHLSAYMVSIGRHPNWGTQPQLGQAGPSIAPKQLVQYVGGTLAGRKLQ